MTSFLLGAALERARGVLAEDRLLRLTPHEVNQLEKALDREPQVVPQLAAVLRRAGAGSTGETVERPMALRAALHFDTARPR